MTGTPADPPPLAVVHPDDAAGRVRLVGELDVATAGLLEDLVRARVAGGQPDVRLDLSGLRFCDVHGLRALLHGSRRLARAGGRLHLHDPAPLLVRTAGLTGWADELGLAVPGA